MLRLGEFYLNLDLFDSGSMIGDMYLDSGIEYHDNVVGLLKCGIFNVLQVGVVENYAQHTVGFLYYVGLYIAVTFS